MKPVAALAISGLVLCNACSGRPPSRSALLAPGWKAPTGQSCALATDPEQLPTVAQVLDTAGLAARLPAALRSGGFATLEIRYDSLGMAGTVHLVESSLDAASREAVVALVHDLQRPRTPFPLQAKKHENSWSALLRIGGDAEIVYQLGRSEFCFPRLLRRKTVQEQLEREFSLFLDKFPVWADQTILMRMQVDTSGSIASAYPTEGADIPELTLFVQRIAVKIKFLPARVNRRLVPTWVTLPISLRIPAEPALPAQPQFPPGRGP